MKASPGVMCCWHSRRWVLRVSWLTFVGGHGVVEKDTVRPPPGCGCHAELPVAGCASVVSRGGWVSRRRLRCTRYSRHVSTRIAVSNRVSATSPMVGSSAIRYSW